MSTESNGRGRLLKLCLAALGVVYGDIGTSPLYTVRICFSDRNQLAVSAANVLGVLSLVLWSLVVLISIKYLIVVIHADNKGEGGILALMALGQRVFEAGTHTVTLAVLGMLGAALLYADGLITPVISVVSAVEGLKTVAPATGHLVVPISMAILTVLFIFQSRGTSTVGAVFGPIMVVWFLVIGLVGALSLAHSPAVLAAIDPRHAVRFLVNHGWHSILTLSAVFLALTGGEALYADMGHFGKRPIQVGWFGLVFPCVILNYFGQGAHLLRHPDQVENLFFRVVPSWAMLPLVVLATVATVIASQAVISGAFSLTRQAVQLGLLPRVTIRHTSSETLGQIYVPVVNWLLFAGALVLLLGFRESEQLAGAYGIAVSVTMIITTVMMAFFVSGTRDWPLWRGLLLLLPFLVLDTAFSAANLLKLLHGGWVVMALAAVLCLVMATWERGRDILKAELKDQTLGEDLFLQDVAARQPLRVPGLAVFLTGNRQGIPRTLLHNVKHNKVIHEKVVLMTVVAEDVPVVEEAQRVRIAELGQGFYRVAIHFGFSEDPDLPAVLAGIQHPALVFNMNAATFFLGRETLLATRRKNLSVWRKHIFSFLSRNALDASKFFRIPPGRVVEFGVRVEI